MNEYLNSVWDLIDINIEDYIQRGFSNLMINFGCTGGNIEVFMQLNKLLGT
jgi:RNase adaptor protein for sRNA GlmZ degradation